MRVSHVLEECKSKNYYNGEGIMSAELRKPVLIPEVYFKTLKGRVHCSMKCHHRLLNTQSIKRVDPHFVIGFLLNFIPFN